MTELSTRDRILKVAGNLFYQEGIRKTGIKEICEKAGVSKPTLYHHFKNKDALISAYLEDLDGKTYGAMKRVFEKTPGTVFEKVSALFDLIGGSATIETWKGCPFMRGASEFPDDRSHPAQEVSQDHKMRMEVWLAQCLADANLQAPRDIARQLIILLDGAVMTVFLHRDPDYAKQSAKIAQLLLKNAEE